MRFLRRLRGNTTAVQEPASYVATILKNTKKLLDDGAITQEEYAAKKKQLLGL